MLPELRSEGLLPGPIPRYEIPGWRDRYGVVAGITGRDFDLGLWTERPVGEVMQRWRAFRAAEPGFSATILGHQVHGSVVAIHAGGAAGWIQLDGVDGHVTQTPGLLLTVTLADCIPVFLLDPRRRAIALLHSGWRGTAGGILRRGLQRLLELAGSTADAVVMHCGVGICGACYEVGSEVMAGCRLGHDGPGPWHVDLRQVLAEEGLALGIGEISVSCWCSAHHRDRFYSHRASGGRDGRMVAYLGYPLVVPMRPVLAPFHPPPD